jgi:predicted membrane chloride channel (bestrophin family)
MVSSEAVLQLLLQMIAIALLFVLLLRRDMAHNAEYTNILQVLQAIQKLNEVQIAHNGGIYRILALLSRYIREHDNSRSLRDYALKMTQEQLDKQTRILLTLEKQMANFPPSTVPPNLIIEHESVREHIELLQNTIDHLMSDKYGRSNP